MRKRQTAKLWAWSLLILLFCTMPVKAQKISSPVQQKNHTYQEVLQQLVRAKVVYLGETHDNPEDHKAELEIVQKLHRQNRKIAIAMEMFQRPYQGVLDQYVAGKITEAQLVEQSEYEQRWGFPYSYYAPILRFAQENHLPVLALNTPTEVTRKVAKQGLESLTPSEREYIPPLAEIRTDNPEYRQMVLAVFREHQQAAHASSTDFERFFTAQVLWDETMAEKIAQFLTHHPDYQVVVLVGQAHIVYGYGIPSRVARRLGSETVQRSILINYSETDEFPTDKPVADYLWKSAD